MQMQLTRWMRVRAIGGVVVLAAAAACGEIESTPTAPSAIGSRGAAVPAGSGRGVPPPTDSTPAPRPAPTPAPAPRPSPAPAPAPAPQPPTSSSTGRLEVAVNPNPVPFSGQAITDIASCRDRPNTWFYDQVLRETGGVAITVTERVDTFDGAVTSRTNPDLRIAANGSTTLRTRWCSSSSAAHTAQTSFRGTDANGRSWSVTGPTVRLSAR
jgi:hypothetical protein